MKEIIKNAAILFTIALISSVLLAVVYSVTKEPIANVQIVQMNKAFETVLPGATTEEITELDLTDYKKIDRVFVAKKGEEVVGYTFKLLTTEGYGDVIELVVGINTEGIITGIDILKHSETPGLGAKSDTPEFKNQFTDKETVDLAVVKGGAKAPNEIDSISGSTITSKAVTYAVNDAIDYYNNELSKEGK